MPQPGTRFLQSENLQMCKLFTCDQLVSTPPSVFFVRSWNRPWDRVETVEHVAQHYLSHSGEP